MSQSRQFLSVLILLTLLLSPVLVHASDQSAEDWYRSSYAPLWLENTPSNMKAAMGHYTSSLNYHGSDGSVMVVDTAEWMNTALTSWDLEGWNGSKMVDLIVTEINPSTYAMVSRWEDHYEKIPVGYSCGWYLVARTDDGWRITTFADHACKD